MKIGIPKELRAGERRVATTPETVKKFIKLGLEVLVEQGAGIAAGYPDDLFKLAGARIAPTEHIFAQPLVLKVAPPSAKEIDSLQPQSLLIGFLEPYAVESPVAALAARRINAIAMEWIPRSSRAQSMDALSSQANIAGYRAVLEATTHYGRFLPMMMTAAGMAKPAKVVVLGAGVAGLQAIATARRLGAQVEAFDIRPEVKEQILSLGAKSIDLPTTESGSGTGGYAKELSAATQAQQAKALGERLVRADIIISTANVPGRRSPILITEEAVAGMRPGSVIVDMAAANGGNCPLSKVDAKVVVNGVTILGYTNYASMVAADASHFYAQNLWHLLNLIIKADKASQQLALNIDLQDDIIAASLASWDGAVRRK